MNLPAALALGGLAASAAIYAGAAAALLRLRMTSRGEPVPGFAPAVSILKPLCGLDEGLEENLESFFRLEYDRYEIVFSFAADTDPAYPVARRVADRHPGVPSVFVFDARDGGGNAKVDRLAAALGRARHRLVLSSDGNVRIRPDFLRRAVSHFADPRVGLVSHLFRASGAVSMASRLEALFLNGCLQPGTAAVASVLRMPCVVGKSILVSRTALEVTGGFPALRYFLAEDFRIGQEVGKAGYRVVLSADTLETSEVRKAGRAVWARHRRWAMMRRRLGGLLYGLEIFSGPLPWAVAAAAAGAWGPAAVLLGLRYGIEGAASARCGRPLSLSDWALLPLRDLGAAGVFWAGLCGTALSWRGRPLRIGKETRILTAA